MNSAVTLKTQISLERSVSFLSPTSRSLCIRSIYRSAISLLYWPSAVLHKKQDDDGPLIILSAVFGRTCNAPQVCVEKELRDNWRSDWSPLLRRQVPKSFASKLELLLPLLTSK